jgi:L-ascorbate metabolism protein UlaG (beta-lactamase superfamily)
LIFNKEKETIMKTRCYLSLSFFLAVIFLIGCAPATTVPTATATLQPATATPTALPTLSPDTVFLKFIGHSSTLITAPDGTRIVSDPFGSSHPEGLADFPKDLIAEMVTVSHDHPDHSNARAVGGSPKIVTAPGDYSIGMITVTGIEGDHGLVKKRSTGKNIVFVFQIGDVKIVHLGAAGVVTQPDILAALQDADVVIMDIMGDTAHPLQEELDQLISLNVRTIIPTHYSLNSSYRYYNSAMLDEFLKIVPADLPVVRQGSTLNVTPNMPHQIMILEPAANEKP